MKIGIEQCSVLLFFYNLFTNIVFCDLIYKIY